MATKTVSKTTGQQSSAVGPLLIGGGLLGLALYSAKGSATKPSITVSTPVVSPGGILLFTIKGFPPNLSVGVAGGFNPAAIVVTDLKGAGAGQLPIPNDASAGTHTLTASVTVNEKVISAATTFKVTVPISGGWHAALTAIPAGTANFTISSGGWLPALNALLTVTATNTPAQVGGWAPALTGLVNATANFTISSGGWLPALTALLTVTATNTPAQVGGWVPALNALVTGTVAYAAPVPSTWQAALNSIVSASVDVQVNLVPASINLTISPAGMGTVTESPGGPFVVGDQVTLTAEGTSTYYFTYVFQYWTIDGVAQNANPLTITLDNPTKEVVAYFIQAGGGGPAFPAPGTPGDGLYWYWVQFTDGSIGWDDSEDVYDNPGEILSIIAGPYASGATG